MCALNSYIIVVHYIPAENLVQNHKILILAEKPNIPFTISVLDVLLCYDDVLAFACSESHVAASTPLPPVLQTTATRRGKMHRIYEWRCRYVLGKCCHRWTQRSCKDPTHSIPPGLSETPCSAGTVTPRTVYHLSLTPCRRFLKTIQGYPISANVMYDVSRCRIFETITNRT